MDILSIIEHKRDKKILSQDEIEYFINEYTINHTITDYQAAALLMAIYLNGLNDKETYYLTNAMINSGTTMNLSNVKGIKIDKHSTGGVGDKVSLILTPICVALGIKVAKISGSGLGHTGGTLDKLESINVHTNISKDKALELLKKQGMFIMSQTEDICIADKYLYALRNSTATVSCLPLIAASVLCKKLVLKTDVVFIDLKVGSGAFCKTINEAKKLAKIMKNLFKQFKRKGVIHITNMTQPLGTCIGNAIEAKAAIDFLDGKFENQAIKNLIYQFAIDICLSTKIVKNKQEAIKKIDKVINDKIALNIFKSWAVSQGSNMKLLNSNFFHPKYRLNIKSLKKGYIKYISTKEIGMISFFLGAGRLKKEDSIDYQAGIKLNKTINDYVKKGDILATLYSSKPIDKSLVKRFNDNVVFSNNKHHQLKEIIGVIK